MNAEERVMLSAAQHDMSLSQLKPKCPLEQKAELKTVFAPDGLETGATVQEREPDGKEVFYLFIS